MGREGREGRGREGLCEWHEVNGGVRRLGREGDLVDSSKKNMMTLHVCFAPPRARLHKQLLASPGCRPQDG